MCVYAELLQLCLTLCDPMHCNQWGSSVQRILQARILEWVAILSSKQSSWPRDQTWVSYISCTVRQVLYHKCHLGSPTHTHTHTHTYTLMCTYMYGNIYVLTYVHMCVYVWQYIVYVCIYIIYIFFPIEWEPISCLLKPIPVTVGD